jgi:hypothetical protein
MRVVWSSRHSYDSGELIKLHLVDADTPESLDQLHEVSTSVVRITCIFLNHAWFCFVCGVIKLFKAPFDTDAENVNSILLTATLFKAKDIADADLPADGSIIKIKNGRNPSLYRDVEPQVTTELYNITVEK